MEHNMIQKLIDLSEVKKMEHHVTNLNDFPNFEKDGTSCHELKRFSQF